MFQREKHGTTMPRNMTQTTPEREESSQKSEDIAIRKSESKKGRNELMTL